MMKNKIKLNNSLFHTIEIPSLSRGNHIDAEPYMIEDEKLEEVKNTFYALAGNPVKGEGVPVLEDYKHVVPRKNTGYFGLSTCALCDDIPLGTFNAMRLNCGIILNRNSQDIKTLIASAIDINSYTRYSDGKHELYITPKDEYVIEDLTDKKFLQAVQDAGGRLVASLPSGDLYHFTEDGILNNPVDYSVKEMLSFTKQIAKQKDLFSISTWNEVLVAAKIGSVSAVFFSGDFENLRGIPVEKSHYVRDSQLFNALAIAGMLHDGIETGPGKKYSAHLPVYEYKRDEISLNRINVEKATERLQNVYADKFTGRTGELINSYAGHKVGMVMG